jgi:hypothetical protein
VKRPHNAYNLYFIERLAIEKEVHPDLTGNEISQLIGKKWSEMDDEARRPYRERARDIHDKFKEDFPDYHYQKASERRRAVPRTLQQIAGDDDQTPQKVMELSLKNLFAYLGSQLLTTYMGQNKTLMDEAASIARGALASGGLDEPLDLIGLNP